MLHTTHYAASSELGEDGRPLDPAEASDVCALSSWGYNPPPPRHVPNPLYDTNLHVGDSRPPAVFIVCRSGTSESGKHHVLGRRPRDIYKAGKTPPVCSMNHLRWQALKVEHPEWHIKQHIDGLRGSSEGLRRAEGLHDPTWDRAHPGRPAGRCTEAHNAR